MIYEIDKLLLPFKEEIDATNDRIKATAKRLSIKESLSSGINNHLFYGLHRGKNNKWIFREFAPNARKIYVIGDFNNWKKTEAYAMKPIGGGSWELELESFFVNHTDLYKFYIEWQGGGGERLPSYVNRCVQDEESKVFSAQVWAPEKPYKWKNDRVRRPTQNLIYECHIGMSSEEEKVASFDDFRLNVLPRVHKLGYNTIQIMALQEHPYYGSFGYQVSNFFALSSRFGTPEQFKQLVDEAHGLGIAVIMDIVHSHAVSNEAEGLSLFDGRDDLYFYHGPQGHHPAWDSRCFDYGKDETLHFLLSNCKYWLEEYRLDGFRFDGVTSMLYWDHGLGKDFTSYDCYFCNNVDQNALCYLALANILIKEIHPDAITIAEDVSGMPGLAAKIEDGGIGFDYRMAMGIADFWIKIIKEKSDEQWSMGELWYQVSNRRSEEHTVSYAECHDQALVGDKTLIFRLMDKEMYFSMNTISQNPIIERGMALIKLIKLLTSTTAGGAYLNFMGNEFGHPEWIDFPRLGNNWSYKYARRQWSLSQADYLRYHYILNFDQGMIGLLKKYELLNKEAVLLTSDEEKQILIYKRGNLLFAFNFNPNTSFGDYGFSAPAGEYKLIFNSDEKEFNGFERVKNGESHFSLDQKNPNGNPAFSNSLFLYLPCRSALVFEIINNK